ncbi:hypothetical protein ACJ5NV_00675 [Loktanella agnita]|uniref:hypothetical protein n=1 Tax=Loktanella agnita TaxID=287097 RepID=UPI00398633D4
MFGFALTPVLCRGMGAAPPPVQNLREFFQPSAGQQVALAETTEGDITVWTEIGPQHAAMLRLDNSNPAFRLSWRETLVAELRNIFPVGALTLTSGWSQLQSSGSGLAGSYTGNRAISAYSASAEASVTVDRGAPYDLWIYYTGRTSGGYCRVEIDGDQALVNEIGDPAGLGFKAFSTHSATDTQRRLSVKVASGLTGSHTVNLRIGGVASPGGSALVIEAVGISGALSDPYILPPAWQPGATYAPGDEVQHGGIFYAARAAGTSGVIGPTHANSIASDGALDWRADNRPTYPKFVAIDYASEREYAARFTVGGAATELGGQTHGHEMLERRTILLDGEPWLPSGAGLSVGAQITITEDTTWQQASGADVAS